ncbi:MAG: hypothetical protein RI564_03075 [Gracilimonas sp.]|jgi:hypothetical protein|nr:hypothetical protein [Gracilimonas sp.]
MQKTTIILKPIKWFKISNYIASTFGLFLFGYIIYNTLFQTSSDPAFVIYLLSGVSIIGSIACLVTIFTQHQHRIVLYEDKITKHGFFDKEIKFSDIEKVIIRKGGVEIHGQGFLETISFGDLHQSYEAGRDFLSRKLSSDLEVEVKGREKFVNQFLAVDA